ncbi:Eco47II family restriction endonuclease [Oceanicaulis sp. AH-315-P02]|nr:Eco47II family restriction endonuclease [Robiginitomaculum sp.]MBN4047692.1 Eco47II family restriction endonuclease [Oceanicaulis sp. AH-315-P02]
MANYNLGFITDELILQHVMETVEKYRQSISIIDLSNFNKNLIDPIKLTFDAKVYGKNLSDIIENEVLRQIDKTNNNHIGYFHQNIFGHLGAGWHVPESGYDIVNLEDNYFVELKNKHNTMNSSSAQKTYIKMQDKILRNSSATCMLVEVIAKNSQNKVWKISLNGERFENENIRRVSIDKFYELVTGDPQSFKKLCEKLPLIISDAVNGLEDVAIENTVLKELESTSGNLLQSLYLLAFEKYEGFGELDISL